MKEYEVQITPNIYYDLVNALIVTGEKNVYLSYTENLILTYFLKNANKIIKKESIVTFVWGANAHEIDSNTVSVHLSRLKKKIPELKNIIKTRRGLGYTLEKKQLDTHIA